MAAGGSSIAAIPARVAETWRSAATTSAKGTIAPSTISHATSAQTGSCSDARWPWSDVVRATTPAGKLYQG